MQALTSKVETEIKIEVTDPLTARRKLREVGFRVKRPRHHEENIVFDFPDHRLSQAGVLVRLRRAANRTILTVKRAADQGGTYKTRAEVDVVLPAQSGLCEALVLMGMEVRFTYEKYRTVYARPGEPGEIMLDETPIGVYMELEGPPQWIDQVASLLGYTPRDYIVASYGELFRKKAQGAELSKGMLFSR